MNILRITTIAFALTLLVACGGGGSSGGTAAVGTPTPMAMMPPPPPVLPTNFEPTENSQTIQDVGETALIDNVPDDMDLFYSDIYEAGNMNKSDTGCAFNSCPLPVPLVALGVVTAIIPAGLNQMATDLSFIAVQGGTSEVTRSVEFGDVTLALGRLPGTTEGVPYRFDTFAGWLDGSIFGTVQISMGTSGSEQRRFASYAIGIPATSNPTGTGQATWEGATVATIKADRTFILGDATITIPDLENPDVDVTFDNWRMTNSEEISDMAAISYENLTLTDGSFTSSASDEQISGRFYETNHAEVGGLFNTMDVTGAFGGTRQ